jgi:hypothetical protein
MGKHEDAMEKVIHDSARVDFQLFRSIHHSSVCYNSQARVADFVSELRCREPPHVTFDAQCHE